MTCTGYPTLTLSMSGTLPSSIIFNAAARVLDGTPASGTSGVYPLIFTASNGVNTNAEQNFTLTINAAPVITSPNTTTFTVGQVGTFTVENLYGIELAGDGINAGTDFVRNFIVAAPGSGRGGSNPPDPQKPVNLSGLLIPVTGFLPDVITDLPTQPVAKMYAAYSDLVLEILRLGVKVIACLHCHFYMN